MDLPHSDACYVRAYPAATAEAWADGHVHAFAFFGRVPLSVHYDNDRCLVARILPDGTRKRATLFSGLLSHYVIEDRYGRPGIAGELQAHADRPDVLRQQRPFLAEDSSLVPGRALRADHWQVGEWHGSSIEPPALPHRRRRASTAS